MCVYIGEYCLLEPTIKLLTNFLLVKQDGDRVVHLLGATVEEHGQLGLVTLQELLEDGRVEQVQPVVHPVPQPLEPDVIHEAGLTVTSRGLVWYGDVTRVRCRLSSFTVSRAKNVTSSLKLSRSGINLKRKCLMGLGLILFGSLLGQVNIKQLPSILTLSRSHCVHF